MKCPVCGGDNKVLATRSDCEAIYRRRKCSSPDCGHVFFSTELELPDSEENFTALNRSYWNEQRRIGDERYGLTRKE